MSVNTVRTEKFISRDLPEMFTATADTAEIAYDQYRARVEEVVGEERSNFDWQALYDFTDEQNSGLEKREEVAAAAASTTIAVWQSPGEGPASFELPLHDPEGMFITVTPQGVPLAAANVDNDKVPKHYGPGDPYVLLQLGAAKLVDAMLHQEADRGEGYLYLVRYELRRGLLKVGQPKHIGMATLYDRPFDDAFMGADRNALAYTGTSGRTLSERARRYIIRDSPAIAARLVNGIAGEPHADDLAGPIDGMSGMVANRVAVYGPSKNCRHESFPDPNDPDHVIVNWE